MPFCPKCRGEFQDWVKVCPICKVEVVAELPPLPQPIDNRHSNVKLVTIARFSHPEEAHIVSARLESEGVWSFVADEYMVTMNWLYSNAIGGVRLQVKESDAAEATRIISLTKSDVQLAAGTRRKCPKCGAADIKYEVFSIQSVFLSWLLTMLTALFAPIAATGGFMLPFLKRKWKCNSCGYQWKNQS